MRATDCPRIRRQPAARPRYVSHEEAEWIKVVHNAFMCLKVAFANEAGALCEYHRVDGRRGGQALAALLPRSTLHPASGADFFCFRPRLLPEGIPDLVIGRTAWDNWLMWMACNHARPPIDATESIVTYHPNHGHEALMSEAGRPGAPKPRAHWPDAPAVLHNRRLVGDRIGDMSDPRWMRC